MKIEMKQYLDKLYKQCSRDTCYPKVASMWSIDNRLYGHCAIVSLIINDYFGGKIIKCKLKEENISHYYNEINGEIIDATINQYKYLPTKMDIHYVEREEILDNPNTMERYIKLKSCIE